MPTWAGALVICLVVLSYVFLGGMRGTTWANAFQTVVFMTLGGLAFYLLSEKLGRPRFVLGKLHAPELTNPGRCSLQKENPSVDLFLLHVHPTVGGDVPAPIPTLAHRQKFKYF